MSPFHFSPKALTDAARERVERLVIDLRLVLALAGLGWLLDQFMAAPVGPDVALAVVNLWVQLAIMIVSAIVAYALAPKPPEPPKPSLEDLSFPTAEEGRPIPVVFGTVWISGPNVLWYGDLSTYPIRSKGGKK